MSSLYLDEILVFLIRAAVRRIREYRSRAWPTTEGRVEQVSPPELPYYPETKVVYTYSAQGRRYSGMHTRAFFFTSLAREYAARFVPTQSLVVRYKPGEPTASAVREADQVRQGAVGTELR